MTSRARPELNGVPQGMDDADAELLQAARTLLEERYVTGVHEVAAAVRLANGEMVLGLHAEAAASRASVCAESAALSAALIAGSPVVSVVSVLRRPGGSLHIIEPCGVCAELLRDHAPAAHVWVGVDDAFVLARVEELLPFARHRAARLTALTAETSSAC